MSTVVALTPEDIGRFFPGSLYDRLRTLLPQAVFLDPHQAREQWPERLAGLAPRLLVTGWNTPRLALERPPHYVCHVAGSVRNLVPRKLLEQGMLVSNWGETVAENVAEGALLLMLSSLRRSHHFADVMHRQKAWPDKSVGTRTLFKKRVGIHGFGAVARRLVALLTPFRVELRAFSAGVPPELFAAHNVTRAESLDALFEWADVLVEAEGFTPELQGVVSADRLRRLRRDAVFVNIARGGLVDEPALAALVTEGRLRVGLDVYGQEPLPASSPLRGQPDAVLFPHVAGPTDDHFHECGEVTLANIERYLRGESPSNLVTLELYDRST